MFHNCYNEAYLLKGACSDPVNSRRISAKSNMMRLLLSTMEPTGIALQAIVSGPDDATIRERRQSAHQASLTRHITATRRATQPAAVRTRGAAIKIESVRN